MIPSSALPLAYYLAAHGGFGAGLLVLAADPSIAAGSFYSPRFVALVHLLTLAWLTGSILGSLYIVGPLALRVPMPVRKADWIAFGSFVFGASGMIAHFWINTYDGMAWSALFVTGAITWVGVRIIDGLRASNVPRGVSLHVLLAFLNITAAAIFGMLIGFDRSRGYLGVSPLAMMFAHIHIAAVGWVTMLVIGLSYRLIPMMLPAEMPSRRSIASSAVLLQCGVIVLSFALLVVPEFAWAGAVSIAAGVAAFATHVRRMAKRRLPRPPALPARDWSTWQTHVAMLWLVVAVVIGVILTIQSPGDRRLELMWVYGVCGLVGFLAQMVVGIQGRLVPLYAWYRAYAAAGSPPARSANALPSPTFARAIFVCWLAAVPQLAWGLSQSDQLVIRAGASTLALGIGLGLTYVIVMIRGATAAPPRTIPHPIMREHQNHA